MSTKAQGGVEVPQEATTRIRPVRNAGYLAAAGLLGKIFSFAFLLYATRALGLGLFGNYSIVLTFVGLFGVLTDLGLGSLAVRDVSQDQSLAVRYVSNLLGVRAVSSALALLLIVILAQFFVTPSLRLAVYVYALALVPIAIVNTLSLVFQFVERLAYSAIIGIVASALIAGLSIAALAMGHHVLALVVVFTSVDICSAAVTAWIVYTRFLPHRMEIDIKWWPTLLRRSAPFMLLTLLNVLYYRADTQILQVLSGCNHAAPNVGCPPVGQYNAAYRLLDILIAVFVGPAATVMLPLFNRMVLESREALRRLVRSAVTLMLAFATPVALLVTFYAPEALYVMGGHRFMVAAPALAVLIWTFPCFLVLSALYSALLALHKQTVQVRAFGVTLVFNVVLNLLLIPHYSYMASSALTVASEVLNGCIVIIALRRTLGPMGLASPTAKVAVVAMVTAVGLWAMHGWSIFVGAPVGIVIVLGGLRLMRVLGPTEHEILAGMPLIGRYARFF